MLRVLTIEDHALVREGLLLALAGIEAGTETFGAETAEDALKVLEARRDIDLILLDLMLPGTSGQAFLGVLRKRFPTIPVVILSAVDDGATVAKVLRLGASGFVPKSSSTEILLDALREVLEGEVYIPEYLRETVAVRGKRRGRTVAQRYGLTAGQARVLTLLAEGKTNRQIAELLGVTEGTVKIHVSAIFKALNVANRSQALLVAGGKKRIQSKPVAVVAGTEVVRGPEADCGPDQAASAETG